MGYLTQTQYPPRAPHLELQAPPFHVGSAPVWSYIDNSISAVTDIFRWGFRGFNYHWGQVRQYTWEELQGNLYEIYPDELADVREIPFGKKTNNFQ